MAERVTTAELQRLLAGERQGRGRVRSAKPTRYRGRTYDSKAEARYAARLDLLLRAGEVTWWARQPEFHLPGDLHLKLDFLVGFEDGRVEAHEVKGHETETWKLKRALLEEAFPDLELVVIPSKEVR